MEIEQLKEQWVDDNVREYFLEKGVRINAKTDEAIRKNLKEKDTRQDGRSALQAYELMVKRICNHHKQKPGVVVFITPQQAAEFHHAPQALVQTVIHTIVEEHPHRKRIEKLYAKHHLGGGREQRFNASLLRSRESVDGFVHHAYVHGLELDEAEINHIWAALSEKDRKQLLEVADAPMIGGHAPVALALSEDQIEHLTDENSNIIYRMAHAIESLYRPERVQEKLAKVIFGVDPVTHKSRVDPAAIEMQPDGAIAFKPVLVNFKDATQKLTNFLGGVGEPESVIERIDPDKRTIYLKLPQYVQREEAERRKRAEQDGKPYELPTASALAKLEDRLTLYLNNPRQRSLAK